MTRTSCTPQATAGALTLLAASFTAPAAAAQHLLYLGPEEIVQDGNGDLQMPSDSTAIYTHWNEDGLEDLVVTNGYSTIPTKVHVFLNVGTAGDPRFSGFFYAQANGGDLEEPPST